MFTEFYSLLKENQVLNLSLMKCGNQLTIGVHPQSPTANDDAKELIIPLVLTATPEELNARFFSLIVKPIEQATTLLANMDTFSKSLEKANAESKAAKEIATKVSKLMKDAEELEKVNKAAEAQIIYKKVLEMDATNTKARSKISELTSKLSQTSLFGEEKPEVVKVPANDLFNEQTDTTATENQTPTPVPPIPESEMPEEPIQNDDTNISAEEWQKFQEFQKLQSTMQES